MLQHSLFLLTFLVYLKSCEMKDSEHITVMVSSQVEPFVIYKSNQQPLKGFDVNIVENFAIKHKLNINFIISNESLNEVFSSDDVKGISHFFKKVDIFIGALDGSTIKSKHLIVSRPYYYDSLTWCVQKRKPIPLRENILHMYRDPVVWTIFTTTSFSIISAVYFAQQFERHQKMDYNQIAILGFGYFCGVPCSFYKPKMDAHRILFVMFIFGSSLYVIIVSSITTKFVTTPLLKPQVKSIREIIDGNFSLAGNRFALTKLSQQNEVNAQINKLMEYTIQ